MKLDDEQILSFLGLAHRAGAVERGAEAARDALRRGDARLVLVASDAAEGQAGKVLRLARSRTVRHRTLADRARLGAAVGGPPLTAVAVTSPSFADELGRRLGPETGGEEPPTLPAGGYTEPPQNEG